MAEDDIDDVRDTRGRFGKGNRSARRKKPNVADRLRRAMAASTSASDVRRITKALIEEAAGGSVSAARLLLAYTAGTPGDADVSRRLDVLERRLMETDQ